MTASWPGPDAAPGSWDPTYSGDPGAEFRRWQRVDARTLVLIAAPLLILLVLVVGTATSGAGSLAAEPQAYIPLVGLVGATVRYLTGRYALVDNALHWNVGLLVRRSTQIGIDRIQDVEVTRPLLAQVFGLAALNVSSAGGAGEIKLSYLDRATAERLGLHLQRLIAVERHAAAMAGAPTMGMAHPAGVLIPPSPATVLHKVTPGELARWTALRFWPAAVGLVVAAAVLVVVGAGAGWLAVLPLVPLVAVGAVKSVIDRWGLTVSLDATSLYTSEGLTTVRRTTTQRERIQLVVGYRLFLQGLLGFESVRYASADVTLNKKEGSVREELGLNVPIGTWERVGSVVAHRPVATAEMLRPKPSATAIAARVRWLAGGVVAGTIAAVVAGSVASVVGDQVDQVPSWPIAASVTFAVVTVALAAVGLARGPARRRVEGWVVTPDDLVCVDGVLRRKTILLFASKTQAVEILSGPLQRRLGLVSVAVDVAPPGRFTRVLIRDVTVADGEELSASLTWAGQIPLPNGV